VGTRPTWLNFETQSYVYFFNKKRKADKPSSVVPYHLSRTCIATGLHRPTLRRERAAPCFRMSVYLVFQPMRFTLPTASLLLRGSLTPPFHPYQANLAVYFLWHWLSKGLRLLSPTR